MVASLLIPLLLAQSTLRPPKPLGEGGCTGESARHVRTAESRAEALNVAGASDAYFTAASMGCADAEVPAHFLRGLVAAREAYRAGGSPASLEAVNQAVAALEARGAKMPGMAEVMRFVLLAAAAAAQSERDAMALLLEHAVHLETIQLEAGQRAVPLATAHELAGDLYLQVHRYEEARAAYQKAVQRLGMTPRIRTGLARTAVRLKDASSACEQYRALIAWWGTRGEPPVEILEARDVVAQPACTATGRR